MLPNGTSEDAAIRALQAATMPVEAEQQVIGAAMLDNSVLPRLLARLKPADFSKAAHGHIWTAISDLAGRGEPADLLTVIDTLRLRGILDDAGGESYVSEILAATPTASHAGYYGRRVIDASIRRKTMTAGQTIYKLAQDGSLDLPVLMERINEQIHNVATIRGDEGFRSMESIVATAWDGLDSMSEPPIPTGITEFDAIIGGFQRGQLVTVAARSGKGKTTFALQCGLNIARRRIPVAIISLEMGEDELLDRLVGRIGHVNMHYYRNGNRGPHDLERIAVAMGQINDLPFFIADRPTPYLSTILADIRAIHGQHGVRLMIVDYVQQIQVEVKRTINSRAQEIGVITQQLKQLARELNITILALAQMNRGVDSAMRKDRRPRLSDLKDSGSIEQDSDIVAFLHYPSDYDDAQPHDLVEVRVEKHRAGPTGNATMRAHLAFSEFVSVK